MRLGDLGAPELLLIVLALVLVFGASRLSESVREFRKTSSERNAPPAPVVSETRASIPDYNPVGVGTGSLPR